MRATRAPTGPSGWSLVEGNHVVGIAASGSDLTIEGAIVRGTLAGANGSFGRGIDCGADPKTG